MFKNRKIGIAFLYFVSVVVMAICYFVLSNKDFIGMIDDFYLAYSDWGILILVALMIWCVFVLVLRDD